MDKTTLNAQLVTTELKCVFYHLLTAKDQICGKFWFGCQWKRINSCLSDLATCQTCLQTLWV